MAVEGRSTTGTLGPVLVGVVVLGGLAAGRDSLVIARHSPGATFGGTSSGAAVLELAAGWALMAAGVVGLRTEGRRAFGLALSAAGLAWLARDWNTPETRSPALFTAGLVLSTTWPVLVLHALLRDARSPTWRGRAVLAVGYVSTTLLSGIAPTLLVQPRNHGCAMCPENLIAVASSSGGAEALSRLGFAIGVGWAICAAILLIDNAVYAHRRRRGAVLATSLPTVVVILLVGVSWWHAEPTGYVGLDPTDLRLQTFEAVLLLALSLGSGWALLLRRRTRKSIARLVVDAARAARPAGLAGVLGEVLGDPGLRILYPLSDDRMAAADGSTASPGVDQQVTRVVRRGETVALIAHRPGLFDAVGASGDVERSTRLLLDNERLQAQARARQRDLIESRARVVAAADAERRQLERDLHDGAQQRLVSTALRLRLAAVRAYRAADPTAQRLSEVEAEVLAAQQAVRMVARGIYPRELADEGLDAALEVMSDLSPTRVSISGVPGQRFSTAVETAAYFSVAALAQRGELDVRVWAEENHLRLDVVCNVPSVDTRRIADRVGALGGSIGVQPSLNGCRIQVDLPCE
jgi:signal transduction histidine kinase